MEFWTLREAESELARLNALTEDEFQAELKASGFDPDEVYQTVDAAIQKAIVLAKLVGN